MPSFQTLALMIVKDDDRGHPAQSKRFRGFTFRFLIGVGRVEWQKQCEFGSPPVRLGHPSLILYAPNTTGSSKASV